ncbi:MAG: hypothetical protein Kapaf2KO_08500 [Candidatus Kapaibacteriales bacterium]
MPLHSSKKIDKPLNFIKNGLKAIKVSGNSMSEKSIEDGSYVLVDTNCEPMPGDIVIWDIEGKRTIKKLALVNGKKALIPAAKGYGPIFLKDSSQNRYIGKVAYAIRNA